MCTQTCKICDKLIISASVSIVTVDGTDTLIIDLPEGVYANATKYCVVIAQAIPTTATINMPVAFSIGGVTTTVYPFINNNCTQVTAAGVRTRTKYPVVVCTNATSGVFRALNTIRCYPTDNLPSLPVT